MKIKAVFFDLDGTLLPMDQDVFVKAYLGSLVQKLASCGYEPKKLIESIWLGTAAMVKNNGGKYNEAVFWDKFVEIFGADAMKKDYDKFEAFYQQDFDKVQAVCGFNADAKKAIDEIKSMGLRVVLATNPIFPAIATQKRIKWAGLTPEDFELYTTYENSRFCKPNVKYYQDIINQIGLMPEECLMVGNDVTEDMVAQKIGMKVFLLPACIINHENEDISLYPQGDFNDLLQYIKTELQ